MEEKLRRENRTLSPRGENRTFPNGENRTFPNGENKTLSPRGKNQKSPKLKFIDFNTSIKEKMIENILSKWKGDSYSQNFPDFILHFRTLRCDNYTDEEKFLHNFFFQRCESVDNKLHKLYHASFTIPIPIELKGEPQIKIRSTDGKMECKPQKKSKIVKRSIKLMSSIKRCISCNMMFYIDENSEVCSECLSLRCVQDIKEICCICKDEDSFCVYYKLPCEHSFHFGCLSKMNKLSCPLCRKDFEFKKIHMSSHYDTECMCNECYKKYEDYDDYEDYE